MLTNISEGTSATCWRFRYIIYDNYYKLHRKNLENWVNNWQNMGTLLCSHWTAIQEGEGGANCLAAW